MSGCCGRFWGPTKPTYGGETVDEVGGSWWLSPWVLFRTRLISGLVFLFLAVWRIIVKWNRMLFVLRSYVLTYVLSGPIYLLLAAVSFQAATALPDDDETQPKKSAAIAQIVSPLHQLVASNALYLVFLFGYHVAADKDYRYVNLVPLPLVLLDFALGAKIRFRITYIWMPVVLELLHSITQISYLSSRDSTYFSTKGHAMVGTHIACAILLLLCAVAVVAFSRISMLCVGPGKGEKEVESEEEEEV